MSDQAGPSGVGGASADTDQALAELLAGGGFCVYPLSWCPHLESLPTLPGSTPDHVSVAAVCEDCGDGQENWLCLVCHTTHCSR